MKSITLLLLFLFSLNLSSQSESKDKFEKLKLSELRNINSDQVVKCDSVITTTSMDGITTPTQKGVYRYDNKGNTITQTQYKWNLTTNLWDKYALYEMEYDKRGNTVCTTRWNFPTNQISTAFRYQTVYDDNGVNVLEEIESSKSSESLAWSNQLKREYQYKNNKLYLKYGYSWDNNEGIWNCTSKDEKEYDDNGNLVSDVSKIWDGYLDSWIEYSAVKQEYNNEGTLVLKETYSWNQNQKSLIKTAKEKYNNLGKIASKITYEWGFYVDSLIQKSKEEYQYNDKGDNVLITTFGWDNENNQWVQNYKEEYQYNINHKVTLYARYLYSFSEDNSYYWRNIKKTEYEYNEQDMLSLRIEYLGLDLIWAPNTKVETEYDHDKRVRTKVSNYIWNQQSGEWLYEMINETTLNEDGTKKYNKYLYYNQDGSFSSEELETYYYSLKDVNSVNENQEESLNVKLYPNPVTDGFYVQGLNDKAQLVLTDLNGRVLFNQSVENNDFINISSLPQGIYLVKIRGVQDNLDQKIIKK